MPGRHLDQCQWTAVGVDAHRGRARVPTRDAEVERENASGHCIDNVRSVRL
jgi:hypothetical protein